MLTSQHIPIYAPSTDEKEWLALKNILINGELAHGPKIIEFEKLFSQMLNFNYSIAVSSCTSGLHLALKSIGIQAGDEVIVPAFTWVSTASAVEHCGATPVFCDVDLDTFNISLDHILSLLTSKTKAIIPVHLFGLCVDIDKIREIIPNNIFIVEDAACAIGSSYKNNFAGSLGDVGVFSFHARKIITTGEGGMITTNKPEIQKKCVSLRNHDFEGAFQDVGFNYKLTEVQAAIGLVQLEKLQQFIAYRGKLAEYYTENIQKLSWITPQYVPSYATKHAYQTYACLLDPDLSPLGRSKLIEKLGSIGISLEPGRYALHMLNYYKNKYQLSENDFPHAKSLNFNLITLPLHNKLDMSQCKFIIEQLIKV
jgi:dTDP-4-amino-4,6-dideoxygalactose transaminase